jgi:hypothetical protein
VRSEIALFHIFELPGADVVPAWRINTPEGSYLVFTRFDHDKPEQRERLFVLISRFMT